MVFKNWNDLEKAIVREVEFAVRDTVYNGHMELIKNLEWFYQTPDPIRYRRTDHLGRASESEASGKPKGGVGLIYLDDSVPYTTGTYDTHKVFSEAEEHGSGIKGNPHFWANTMDTINKSIMPVAFRNHGFYIK